MSLDQAFIPHLFRTEYRKIVAVLARFVGAENMEVAEDIASDTFLIAIETWGLKGLPENPVAWLHNVARNNLKTYLQRHTLFQTKITAAVQQSSPHAYEPEIDLSAANINDSQLLMMFAVCNPVLSPESQICLALRVLCGFGIEEIADAFLTTKATINKRLFRAKETLRKNQVKIELPGALEMNGRLETVLMTIYLLFNEGYYSISQATVLRRELCLEAMRLCHMLVDNEATNEPACNALLALMCFHASRFEARVQNGEFVLYQDQDPTLWSTELIERGEDFLNRAVVGETLSRYHLEAMIAYWHTCKLPEDVKWNNILQLYDHLLQIAYSPNAALNRVYAYSKVKGKQTAIVQAERLSLKNSFLYEVLMGELYMSISKEEAHHHLKKALALAKTTADKQSIQAKINMVAPF